MTPKSEGGHRYEPTYNYSHDAKFIAAELERMAKNVHDLRNDLNATGLQLAVAKAQIAVWAAIGGIFGAWILPWLFNHFK